MWLVLAQPPCTVSFGGHDGRSAVVLVLSGVWVRRRVQTGSPASGRSARSGRASAEL
jgi:hypothetical protein